MPRENYTTLCHDVPRSLLGTYAAMFEKNKLVPRACTGKQETATACGSLVPLKNLRPTIFTKRGVHVERDVYLEKGLYFRRAGKEGTLGANLRYTSSEILSIQILSKFRDPYLLRGGIVGAEIEFIAVGKYFVRRVAAFGVYRPCLCLCQCETYFTDKFEGKSTWKSSCE